MSKNFDFHPPILPTEPHDIPPSETESHSLWRERAAKNLSPEDKEQWKRLRGLVEKKEKNQTWYYAASGADMLPVLLAPDGTRHEFMDPAYQYLQKPESRFRRELMMPFEKLDVPANLGLSNTNTKSLELEDGTVIVLYGTHAENAVEGSAEQLDVVYNNETPGEAAPTSALDRLKLGGFFIYGSRHLHCQRADHFTGTMDKLENYGFRNLMKLKSLH